MARAHVALQRRLADCFAGRVVSDPREEPYYRKILGLDGGPWRETANYQAMLVASWVWRVRLLPLSPALLEEHAQAMEQVEKLYALEREQGMFRGECLCPDPHAGMHLEAHVAIFRAAVESGGPRFRDLTLDWLGRALRLYYALASPDGEPWVPGLRVKTKLPRNQAAAALLRAVLGLRHRRENGRVVLLPLRVVRFKDGFLASLQQPARPPRNGWLEPVDWLLVRWGRPGRHDVQVGRNWQTPAPEVSGRTQTIG